MIESLQQFVETTDPLWQWLAVILISAIPYVESYFGAILGVAAGVPVPIAIVGAIVGNWVSMFVLVLLAHRLRGNREISEESMSPRKQRFMRAYNKYGVPGVSLLGQTILPSQLTSMAMVSFGASKAAVIFWQTIAIIMWGVLCGFLAVWGIQLL